MVHLAALAGFPICQAVGRDVACRFNIEATQRVFDQADQMGIGRALNFQGRLAIRRSDFASARDFLERAQAIFKQTGDQTALADNLEYLKRLALLEKRL